MRLTLTAGLVLALAASAAAQTAKPPYGAATPQEVVAAVQKAAQASDFLGAIPFISPAGRRALMTEGVEGLLMVLAFSDPDDAMPGSKPLPKAELDAKRKNYRTATEIAQAALKPYGLDLVIGKPVMAPETTKTIASAAGKADTVVAINSLMAALEKMAPLLGMKKDAKPKMPFDLGAVSGYQIKGDTATAKSPTEMLDFVRVDGRWFISPPAPKGK